MGDGLFHLDLVGRTNIEDVAAHRLVQCHCAGGWAHQHHAGFVEQRHDALGVWGSPCHEERNGAVFLDEGAGVFQRQLGVELVVQHHQFNFLATHASLGVHKIQVQRRTLHGFFDGDGRRARDAHRLSNDDLRHAVASQSCRQCTSCQQGFPFFHACTYLSSGPSLGRRAEPDNEETQRPHACALCASSATHT